MPLVIAERKLPISVVEPGMLLKITYTKLTGETNNYNIFVVNQNKANAKTNTRQLHAYVLDDIKESDFINIFVNMKSTLVIDSSNKELRTKDITDTEAYEAIYTIGRFKDRPYRTFNIEAVSNVNQMFIILPPQIDEIVKGLIFIDDKNSKRKLLTCIENEDIECMKEVKEIRAALLPEESEYKKSVDEESEREVKTSSKKRDFRQVFRNNK